MAVDVSKGGRQGGETVRCSMCCCIRLTAALSLCRPFFVSTFHVLSTFLRVNVSTFRFARLSTSASWGWRLRFQVHVSAVSVSVTSSPWDCQMLYDSRLLRITARGVRRSSDYRESELSTDRALSVNPSLQIRTETEATAVCRC
jgi:hypothetical protein